MIPNVSVNFWAVIAAAAASFVIGMAWFSDMFFGKEWMKLSGRKQSDIKKAKRKGIGLTMLIAFALALITSYVLANIAIYAGASGISDGIRLGVWMWLGFAMPLNLGIVLWEGKSFKLFLIQTSHILVELVAMAIILVKWY